LQNKRTVFMGKSVKLIVEALLFSSEKPLNAKDIHAVMPEISMPDISSARQAAEAILALSPETNGRVAVKAWAELSRKTGLDLDPVYRNFIFHLAFAPDKLEREFDT